MRHNFQNDKQLSANQTHIQSPGMLAFQGLFYVRLVHWNARMTEMKRSGIEVHLVFADNGKFSKR